MAGNRKVYRTDFYQGEDERYSFREAFETARDKWNVVEVDNVRISRRGILSCGQERSLIARALDRADAKEMLSDYAERKETAFSIDAEAFGDSGWRRYNKMKLTP